jgi:hypothetical protein
MNETTLALAFAALIAASVAVCRFIDRRWPR